MVTVQELDGPAATRITLHDTGPARTATRSCSPGGEPRGRGADHAPVLYFDAPRAPEQADAEEFACAGQRIWPTIRDMTGLVGVWVLRGPQSATVVCTLATSVPALDAITRAVLA